MKRVIHGLYSLSDNEQKKYPNLKLWHDCKKYKDRETARVELVEVDKGKFGCWYCSFRYRNE